MIESRTLRYFRDKVDAKKKKGIFELHNLWIAAIYKVNIIIKIIKLYVLY